MQVVVEDVLARGCTGNMVKPDSGRAEDVAQSARNVSSDQADRRERVVVDLPEVTAMSARYDERMASGRRGDVEERHNRVV